MKLIDLFEAVSISVAGRKIPITIDEFSKRHGDKLVNLNVPVFDKAFSREHSFYIGPGGQSGIGKRYEEFGKFVEKAASIEASEVGVRQNGVIDFGNGRHRYAWLRDQGLKVIPVAMSKESITYAKQYGYLV